MSFGGCEHIKQKLLHRSVMRSALWAEFLRYNTRSAFRFGLIFMMSPSPRKDRAGSSRNELHGVLFARLSKNKYPANPDGICSTLPRTTKYSDARSSGEKSKSSVIRRMLASDSMTSLNGKIELDVSFNTVLPLHPAF